MAKAYQQVFIGGLRAAARQFVSGKPGKAEEALLKCLMEAYRTYSALNAEAPENQAVNLAFINQAAPNIKKKPQPLKGFEGKSLTELITNHHH